MCCKIEMQCEMSRADIGDESQLTESECNKALTSKNKLYYHLYISKEAAT